MITINEPVVFMARYIMVLRGATSLQGHWKGWALKIDASAIWAQKSAIKTIGTLVVLCT